MTGLNTDPIASPQPLSGGEGLRSASIMGLVCLNSFFSDNSEYFTINFPIKDLVFQDAWFLKFALVLFKHLVDGIAVFNLEDEHGFLLLFVGEKIRMLKLGCKGKSSSAKITASGKIFGVLLENQFYPKEKCLQIRRINSRNAFLCPRKLHCPPNINKSYLKPYA